MGVLEREIDDINRFREIMRILFEEEFGYFMDRLNLLGHVPWLHRIRGSKETMPAPERVRETFERLGPTFIKFGQVLAQRPDVVPEPYVKELEKLEDDVPAFDSEVARDIVQQEIGPIEEHFTHFEDEPLAAASIAQVHRATLESGEEVVVKIRRPGIKQQMEEDLDILMFLAKRGENHVSKLEHMEAHKYVKRFADWTRDELNLYKEGHNAEIMRENLDDESRVKIPEIYTEYTTERVLVMEYMEGVKCTDTDALQDIDVSKEELANTIIRIGLKQTVRDGFFHADPHPSNFLIDEDGSIVLLDFGMIGKFSLNTRRNLGMLMLHAANEDAEAATDTVRRMATIEPDADMEQLKTEIENHILAIKHSTLQESSITQELLDMALRASELGVHMPPSLAVMAKGLATMEGIGLTIYPEFQPDNEIRQQVPHLLRDLNDPKQMINTFLLDLMENRDMFVRLPSQLNKAINSLESEKTTIIDNAAKNQMNPLLIGALVLSSSLLFIETLPTDQLLYIGIAELGIAAYLLQKL